MQRRRPRQPSWIGVAGFWVQGVRLPLGDSLLAQLGYLLRHVVQEIAEGYAHRVIEGANELALELVEVDQTIAVRLHLVFSLDIGDKFGLLRRAEMRRRRSRARRELLLMLPGVRRWRLCG